MKAERGDLNLAYSRLGLKLTSCFRFALRCDIAGDGTRVGDCAAEDEAGEGPGSGSGGGGSARDALKLSM